LSTRLGAYKKENNVTTFKWKNADSLEEMESVIVESSLEMLKTTTIQIEIFLDRDYGSFIT
jgi:hypothetical protein